MLDVRYSTMDDKRNVLLLQENFCYAGDSQVRGAKDSNSAVFDEATMNESLILLCRNGVPIGYAFMQGIEEEDGSLTAKIQEIFVAKMFQRSGKGKEFVNMICEMMKSEGFDRMEIFSANMETDRFWEKCGFLPVSKFKDGVVVLTDVYQRAI